MSVEIKVPVLPESVSDATMLEWHKAEGDPVRRDENLVDVETEKVVLEVPAPADGVLAKIVRQAGETVLAEEVIAILEPGTVAADPGAAAPEATAPEPPGVSPPLSPAVRRLVTEHGLDPSRIDGTGKDGRITKADVLAYFTEQSAPERTETPPVPPAARPTAPVRTAPSGERTERREPMSRLRRTIATRLVEAQQTAALLTTFNEVDLGTVLELRKRHREDFEERHGVRLGLMSFFVKASVEALLRFPAVNAFIDGDEIVHHDYCDVGIAVSSPRGLVVPVIRSAQTLGFADIEKTITDFGVRARDASLRMDELTGGTFTITNGGVFGSLVSTPIINPPQSAILGMHKTQERPVAIDGAVVIRPMMYLALSYDHRIVDGREAVQFLVTIKETLEDPTRLLLDV